MIFVLCALYGSRIRPSNQNSYEKTIVYNKYRDDGKRIKIIGKEKEIRSIKI